MATFRKVNMAGAQDELGRLFHRVTKRTGFVFERSPRLNVFTNDTFTVATAFYDRFGGVGATKRMPKDKPSLQVGVNVAVIRALEDLVAKIEGRAGEL